MAAAPAVVAGVVVVVVGPRHKSYGIVCPACALLAVRHCAPALRTSLMAHLGHLGAWHGSEVAGGDSSAVQERGNSAEEERDTVKSSVADRRPWNLGETRHNGFEGADLNIPEAALLYITDRRRRGLSCRQTRKQQ